MELVAGVRRKAAHHAQVNQSRADTQLEFLRVLLTEHDIQLAKRDGQLPGMTLLLDAAAIGHVLKENGHDGDGLRLMYVRYKPGVNMLAGYGRGDVVELYAKTFRPTDAVKLGKARRRKESGDTGPPRSVVVDGPGVVVSLFPDDAKLRSLERLNYHREIRRMARMAGASRRRSVLEPIRYKPERRFVARLSDRRGAAACVKTFTCDGLKRAYAGWRSIATDSSIPAPKLIGEIPHLSTLVFEWVRGRSLHDLLTDSAWDEVYVKAAGEVLARLHKLSPDRLPRHAAAAMTQSAMDLQRTLVMLLPDRKTQLASLFRDARRVVGELSARQCFLHGDFNQEQVMVGDEGVQLLDFDRTAMGPPKIDLATFAAHLELDVTARHLDGDEVEAIVRSLKSGYLSEGGRLTTPLAPLTGVVLLQLASTPFRRGHRDWSDRMSLILDRCEELFDRRSVRRRVRPDKIDDSSRRAETVVGSKVQAAHSKAIESDATSDSADAELLEAQLLEHALDPDHVANALQSQTPAATDSQAPTSARLLKRRPGKRFVVEYTCERTGYDLIGKVRLKGVNRRSFHIMRELHELGFTAEGGRAFAVPRPIGLLHELHMSLFQKARARSSVEELLSEDGPETAWSIGEALASLHTVRALTDRHHTVPRELEILTECLTRFATSHPDRAPRTDDILSRCRQLVSDAPYSLAAIHRDFHPENVLVDGQQVYFIDFDLYALGDPAIDAGNFVGHLVELAIREYGDSTALDGLVGAFCAGYNEADGPAERNRIQSFATLTLARHIYLSTVRPGRSSTTEVLMEVCEQRLRRAAAA